jgi:predicted ATPase
MTEVMTVNEEIFVGREQELERVKRLMTQKRNIVVFGQKGVGKSALVSRIVREMNPESLLYSSESGQFKQTLLNLISHRGEVTRTFGESSILALKKTAYKLLDQNPAYVILDHVGWVEPKYYGFLGYIIERNVPLMVVGRATERKEVGHLWLAMYEFEKIQIRNLEREATHELVRRWLSFLKLDAVDADKFAVKVARISRGNPEIITDLCLLARHAKYRSGGHLDVKLMDLDRRIREVTSSGPN